MDHWNFYNGGAEPTLMDINRSLNSNPAALNRFNSLNSSMNNSHSGVGPFGSMNGVGGLSNSSSNSSLHMRGNFGPQSANLSSINPFTSSALNSLSSALSGGNASNFCGFPSTNGPVSGGPQYNLNSSMHGGPHNSLGSSVGGYGHSQPHTAASRSRFMSTGSSSNSGYFDHSNGSGLHTGRNPPYPTTPPAMLSSNPYFAGHHNGSSVSSSSSLYGGSNIFNSNSSSIFQANSRGVSTHNGPSSGSSTSSFFDSNTSGNSGPNNAFPPIGEFKIGTFSIGPNGQPSESNSSDSLSRGQSNQNGDNNQNVRETGIIEKLLQTYGFIQCCERQARLFFHFSQFEGNTDHLRIGDPVEFEVTFDKRTGKPIASSVTKISPDVVLSEERVVGAVTTALSESNSDSLGRISYENRGECFFLPYCKEDVEGYVVLKPGDKVSFQIATNQRSGNLAARHVRLENPVTPVRYQGVVSAIKDTYGFIERADVVDEIFFHIPEAKHIPGGLKLGDDVDFCIAMQNGKEVATELVKLKDGSVVFEDTSQEVVRGQVLKPVERSPRHNLKEPLPGRIRYRGKDRSEVEVKFGERDQRGEFTLRHGDWVEFNIATDRRDRLQKATNITLLDESFEVSGEKREQGTVHTLSEEYGYIICLDRDLLLHFNYRELLNPNRAVSVNDVLVFTIGSDSTLSGPRKETATRIAHVDAKSVVQDVSIQDNLQGNVAIMAERSPPVVPPSLPGSLVLPAKVLGEIVYLVEGSQHHLDYVYSDYSAHINVGDKVTFSIYLSRQFKKLMAYNLQLFAVTPTVDESVDLLQQQQSDAPTFITSLYKSLSAAAAPELGAFSNGSLQTSSPGRVSPPSESSFSFPTKKGSTSNLKSYSSSKRLVHQGYVAALKESFGFLETLDHSKEIFFHFSNVEGGESTKLELGDEVEYTLSARGSANGKVSAENVTLLPKGTLPLPKVLDTVYNGLVIRPIRSSNPDQSEYCGLLAIDTDDLERSEQYKFGITGLVYKRELLQKGDTVTFQVDEGNWATNIVAVRKKLIATVDTVKGQYGFLNYETEEGKKLFFHQTEVKDKSALSPGDEVEFVIITNQKTGKSSACNITRIMSARGQSRRPQRLISQLKSVDQTKPRILVLRQPRGPDGTKGFTFSRGEQLAAQALI